MGETKNLNENTKTNEVENNEATNIVENGNVENGNDKEVQKNEVNQDEVSLSEQVAQLRLENAKQKRALDKAMKEASGFKKQLREKQSVEEIEAQEKAEREAQREEEFNKLKKEVEVNKLEKTFLALGYPEENAHKSAVAQYDGDMDTVFAIQKEWREQIKNETKAEFIANNPEINTGENQEEESDPFLEGFNSVK